MIDLGYRGPDFTWSNGTVKERLDRCLCNGDWRLCFPESKVIHLPKVCSDHCPVMVKLHPSIGNTRTDPPFRFQAMWMQHEEYAEFVTDSWKRPSLSFFEKIISLASDLNLWNKNVFGNILNRSIYSWLDLVVSKDVDVIVIISF